ncbi:MAG: FAD-binding protein, partial [candidate division Zixibacteria bacterium]|nr:FAD-binding protein [candidate division Zixibacteria bacterium]
MKDLMKNVMDRAEFDIIVIGSGIAGLSYALTVAEGNPRLQVAIVTKKERPDSNTNYAQGGIAATLSPNDTAQMHIDDTLRSGCGLCRVDVVTKIVKLGPRSVNKLIERGVSFTRSPRKNDSSQADLDLALEGGHSARRVAHAADLTGREIERALLEGISASPNITVFENLIACDALQAVDCAVPTIAGILAYDSSRSEFRELSGKLTMIATGGVGQVYAHTTNPLIATGDGLAMAFRAGATVANLEFMQFHPTAFYEDADHSFLISEAVRGEGGRLVNGAGHAFMLDYDSRGDLAPR